MREWLDKHWVPAALCMAIMLTVLMPIFAQHWRSSWLLIFTMLPIYMFHQVEEQTGDRFRVFVNQHVFHGVEALTPVAVLWINLPGVWGVGVISIYAATFGGMGWGLSMVYLVLVNAVAHVVAAILWREYNPALWTALALFVPAGTLALVAISGVPGVERIHHVVGLAVGIGDCCLYPEQREDHSAVIWLGHFPKLVGVAPNRQVSERRGFGETPKPFLIQGSFNRILR
jgi:hypothetical protein